MTTNQVDVRAERAKFLNQRQAKLDAAENQGGADGSERGTLKSQYANPPAVRATDGGEPGTKERNPLAVAAELEGDDQGADGEAADGVPTNESTIPQIKAYLDEKGIGYDGVTKKADFLALVPQE
ncbi:hypothetical protein [Hymenobacter fodinae]|uniref:HeH/LEM domain-containing protein n=1 Tax=Hymenobacter fodinae TaxID=2510796 RepID=A0A4Z0P0U0_9BACT|nr:hypothetical protein [Hymenobacter fodinae]TGE04633.1 hypothetical protein EU556_20830 [Hymenobacter fodinae]